MEELASMTRPIPKFKFGHGTIVVVVVLSRCSLSATLTPERSCMLSVKLVTAPAENYTHPRGIGWVELYPNTCDTHVASIALQTYNHAVSTLR